MKKLLLSLGILLVLTGTANAQWRTVRRQHVRHNYYTAPARQRPRPQTQAPYYYGIGDVRLHVVGELGISDPIGVFWHQYPEHYSIGGMAEVQTGRHLSLGLGAEYYGTSSITDHYDVPDYLNTVPIYGNIRLSSAGRNTKLFVEGRVGYAIATNQALATNPYRYVEAQGFYTGLGVGFSCYGNSFSVGFNSIDLRNPLSNQFILYNNGSKTMVTDFYLRYSFAIPMNY